MPEDHSVPIPIFRLLQKAEMFDPMNDFYMNDSCFELVPTSWAATHHRSARLVFRRITTVPLVIHVR